MCGGAATLVSGSLVLPDRDALTFAGSLLFRSRVSPSCSLGFRSLGAQSPSNLASLYQVDMLKLRMIS